MSLTFRYQSTKYNCGPACIQNALALAGRKYSQKRIAEWCGTSKDGSDEFDIMRGLTAVGLNYYEIRAESAREAYDHITSTFVAILCVDEWRHWVLTIRSGGTVMLVDPFRESGTVGRSCPVQIIKPTQFLRRWRGSYHDVDVDMPWYYGIGVRYY